MQADTTPRRTRLYHQVLATLERRGPLTISWLAATISRHAESVREHVKVMHADKQVHISGWQQDGHRPAAIYSFGPGADVPCVVVARAPPPRKEKPKAVPAPVAKPTKSVLRERTFVDLSGAAFRTVLAPGVAWPYSRGPK